MVTQGYRRTITMAAYCKQHCSQPNIAAEELTNAGLRHSLKRTINSLVN